MRTGAPWFPGCETIGVLSTVERLAERRKAAFGTDLTGPSGVWQLDCQVTQVGPRSTLATVTLSVHTCKAER